MGFLQGAGHRAGLRGAAEVVSRVRLAREEVSQQDLTLHWLWKPCIIAKSSSILPLLHQQTAPEEDFDKAAFPWKVKS